MHEAQAKEGAALRERGGEVPMEAQALQTPGPMYLLTHFTFPLTRPK